MLRRFILRLLTLLGCVALTASAAAQVQRIGALSAAGESDELKHAIEDKGYRVTLDDGWTAEFWFAKQLKAATKDVSGALYPELANAEFVGAVNFPKGMTDFRGQSIPAGVYTLRYQLLPQDGNHLGVAPNPDFLLAIPVASDAHPEETYPYKKLVALSAKSTGGSHPAVIAMEGAGEPGTVTKTEAGSVFTVAILAGSGTQKIGICLTCSASQ